MKKIYITGVSGTGKTTVANELKKRGYYALSIDEVDGLCQWIHNQTGKRGGAKDAVMDLEFVDQHEWVCDIELLNKLLDKDVEVAFVLGMAYNQDDFLPEFDKVLLLQCKPETFVKRIEGRTDNPFGQDTKVQEQILNRYQPYAKEMLSKGAISIDTDRPIDVVVDEVIKQTNSL